LIVGKLFKIIIIFLILPSQQDFTISPIYHLHISIITDDIELLVELYLNSKALKSI